jgi:methylphosphonate synthase
MNTGDSMYITPFVSHTFATRKGAKQNGLILALTYGGKLTGDVQQELSSISTALGSEFALNFTSKELATSSLIKYHREIASLTIDEIAKRSKIAAEKIRKFENGTLTPTDSELYGIANAMNVNTRDLLANDKIEEKVAIKHHDEGRSWYYPESTKAYEFLELASTTALPYSKAFEVNVLNYDDPELDLHAGLHQYVYNIGDTKVNMNWTFADKRYGDVIHPGDSVYVKPFLKHNFRGSGKLLMLRIGGRLAGDSQRELSFVGKENARRAISETMQWFDPKGKN